MAMNRTQIVRYHFEDQGQDLLWFDIQDGEIISAGPFHHEIYAGQLNYDFYAEEEIKLGGNVRYSKTPMDNISYIKYPVVAIQRWRAGEKPDTHAPYQWDTVKISYPEVGRMLEARKKQGRGLNGDHRREQYRARRLKRSR